MSEFKAKRKRVMKRQRAKDRTAAEKQRVIAAAKPVLEILEKKFGPLPANAGLIAGLAHSTKRS